MSGLLAGSRSPAGHPLVHLNRPATSRQAQRSAGLRRNLSPRLTDPRNPPPLSRHGNGSYGEDGPPLTQEERAEPCQKVFWGFFSVCLFGVFSFSPFSLFFFFLHFPQPTDSRFNPLRSHLPPWETDYGKAIRQHAIPIPINGRSGKIVACLASPDE